MYTGSSATTPPLKFTTQSNIEIINRLLHTDILLVIMILAFILLIIYLNYNLGYCLNTECPR